MTREPKFHLSYFKASLLTSLLASFLPALFLIWSSLEMGSTGWDPQGDNGAATGLLIGFFTLGLVTVTTAGVYPFSAFLLNRKGYLSPWPFRTLNFGISSFLAIIISFFIASQLGVQGLDKESLQVIVTNWFLLVFLSGIFTIPLSGLWLRWARR